MQRIDGANDADYAVILQTMERSRIGFLIWLGLAVIVEGGSLVAFILLADWHDRLHQLLGVMSLLIYGTLGLCLMAMFVHVRYWILRVIKAVEVLARENGRSDSTRD